MRDLLTDCIAVMKCFMLLQGHLGLVSEPDKYRGYDDALHVHQLLR